MEEKFSERLGLDFLKRKESVQQTSEKSESPPFMEETLIAYGRQVLEGLTSLPNKAGQVFDLIDRLGIRIETLIPVVQFLVSRGYLEITKDDLKGNYTIRLTDRGAKLIG